MNRKKYLYSSGEFAKLTGANKRTLHYYHDIGLFSPESIGENGYHYYTCFIHEATKYHAQGHMVGKGKHWDSEPVFSVVTCL